MACEEDGGRNLESGVRTTGSIPFDDDNHYGHLNFLPVLLNAVFVTENTGYGKVFHLQLMMLINTPN